MKIRNGFVSNSSSSSFILGFKHELTDEDKKKFLLDIVPDSIKKEYNFNDKKMVNAFCSSFVKTNDSLEEYFGEKINTLESDLSHKIYKLPYSVDTGRGNIMYLSKRSYPKLKKYFKANKLCGYHLFNNSFKNLWKMCKKDMIERLEVFKEDYDKFSKYGYNITYCVDFVGCGDGGEIHFTNNKTYLYLYDLWCKRELTNEFHKHLLKVEEY